MRTVSEVQVKLIELKETRETYMDYLRNLPPDEDIYLILDTITCLSQRIESLQWVLIEKEEFSNNPIHPIDR